MKQRKSSTSVLILGLALLALFFVPAAAQSSSAAPQLPQAFIGVIEVEGLSAPEGLIVEAVGPGIRSGIQGNPVTTLTGGMYGSLEIGGQKLLVQGDIEVGTPIEFYVGGVKAEVFPVDDGGPLEAYPYLPGEVTELNLRIASQPSVGDTREPTPVQTRISSGEVPTIAGYAGPDLPQPEVVATYQQGEVAVTQPATGQETSAQIVPQGGESTGTPVQGGQETESTPASPATTSAPGMLTGTAIVAFLVIIGTAAYRTSRKKSEDKNKEE